ncbi:MULTISPECIES: cytochrome b [Dickeya]|uniref:Cytochrome b n=1 Tax=Dickeya oryzae TaxID=1240404 RepID=A0AB39IBE3_9GAMM|nr:cytochrome b [Dickeya oryzae]MBP2848717.1 cytochrome b [Dickeya oryzae]MBP2856665.1 cytochrome b [Dickeya oryzae]MCA6990678.1 cytochrome b [Dickeya oryzae]MCA6993767.1 cytochrome b [Dickeya oryzae]
MVWRNTSTRYGYISVLLHWASAITVYGMFALGLWMVTLGYYNPWYHNAPEIHKGIGILLFLTLLFRVIWRWLSPPPPALSSYSTLTRIGATAAHVFLYLLLFSILISGYLISTAEGQAISVFGWFSVPATLSGIQNQADSAGKIHLYLAWSVVILSVLHALAALKHHFIDRDVTLKRMSGRHVD